MTYKEFLAWLEGYVAGIDPDKVNSSTVATIVSKARTVKEESVVESTVNKVKQFLND